MAGSCWPPADAYRSGAKGAATTRARERHAVVVRNKAPWYTALSTFIRVVLMTTIGTCSESPWSPAPVPVSARQPRELLCGPGFHVVAVALSGGLIALANQIGEPQLYDVTDDAAVEGTAR